MYGTLASAYFRDGYKYSPPDETTLEGAGHLEDPHGLVLAPSTDASDSSLPIAHVKKMWAFQRIQNNSNCGIIFHLHLDVCQRLPEAAGGNAWLHSKQQCMCVCVCVCVCVHDEVSETRVLLRQPSVRLGQTQSTRGCMRRA